jgi:hypothetical protein
MDNQGAQDESEADGGAKDATGKGEHGCKHVPRQALHAEDCLGEVRRRRLKHGPGA